MKKKVLISHMRNENEEIEVSRNDTANTFAKFYSNLHSDEIHKADKKKKTKKRFPTDAAIWKMKKKALNTRTTSLEKLTAKRTTRTKTSTSLISRNKRFRRRSIVLKEGNPETQKESELKTSRRMTTRQGKR